MVCLIISLWNIVYSQFLSYSLSNFWLIRILCEPNRYGSAIFSVIQIHSLYMSVYVHMPFVENCYIDYYNWYFNIYICIYNIDISFTWCVSRFSVDCFMWITFYTLDEYTAWYATKPKSPVLRSIAFSWFH